jgi:membrane fusion protein (multidrug efflux system)
MNSKALFGALVMFIMASSCSNIENNKTIVEYPVIQPKKETTTFQMSYVAEINAIENIEIRSRIDGVIEKILVDEGEFVNQGQVLIQIEANTFIQDLKKAEANLTAKNAELKAVKIELENARRLYAKNIISKTEIELIESKETAALANIEEAKGNQAQCELNLSYTKIKAPFSGRVNRILLKRGSIANQESLITTLSNDKEVFAYFNLNESDYLKLTKSTDFKQKKTVDLQLADGTIYPVKGEIETAESEVDRNTGNIALRARFVNSNGYLKHGSSGRVIWSKQINNALLIPKQSTFEVQELIYVYVINSQGIAKQRSIKINGQLPLYYSVESGLNEEDFVLFEGIQMVRNNEQIQAKKIEFPNIK